MVASVAAREEEYDPGKAFDLGIEPQPLAREIPVELYNLDGFPKEAENPVTPTVRAPIVPSNVIAAEPSQVNNDLKERCVIWALSDKKEIKYDTIFRIKGDWHYEVVRKQFRSMRNGKEIDLAVVIAMSLVLNSEPIKRFQSEIYIFPPDTLTSMFRRYNDDYIDVRTRRPHSITSLVTHDHLNLVDKAKLITHRYIFAPVLYAKHWWLYIHYKSKKTFYVLDLKNKTSPSQERTKIHRFGCNIMDQLLVYAGHHSLLAKATKRKNAQIVFIPRHIDIHEQPNEFDCGTFVMKWMEVIDPTQIDPIKPYPIEAWSTVDLQGFRKEIIWKIVLSEENLYVQKAIDGAISTTIHRPSTALQSPYRNHEETEEEEENREQRKLESSYREPKLLQGNIKVTLTWPKRDSLQGPKASQNQYSSHVWAWCMPSPKRDPSMSQGSSPSLHQNKSCHVWPSPLTWPNITSMDSRQA
ncbi:hypothetical protein PIB30_093747 [Stylosanthes scabra]|uniref:Ubiquitin-like protease family profile domain-containing protein n=1 Tax=Stylosanthes scabra TaxID=79078 RepID=A0ABU6QWL8_9FABA|nr:hypothetical protein [Stylosanthes scabra]